MIIAIYTGICSNIIHIFGLIYDVIHVIGVLVCTYMPVDMYGHEIDI